MFEVYMHVLVMSFNSQWLRVEPNLALRRTEGELLLCVQGLGKCHKSLANMFILHIVPLI